MSPLNPRKARIVPLATVLLMLAVAMPIQASPLDAVRTDLSVSTPLGPIQAGVQGTNSQIYTPAANAEIGLQGTAVSACAAAYPPFVPIGAADLCVEADAEQQVEDVTHEAKSKVDSLLSRIGGFLRGLF